MPTGYTSGIYDGKEISLKEYILKCARAFGATITMRDDPMDKEITEFEPSNYHKNALEKAKNDLKKYEIITNEEVQKEINEIYENSVQYYNKKVKEYDDLESRYKKMLKEVSEWIPPTKEHVRLKEFALSQLEDSIAWDCNKSYLTYPTKLDSQEWVKIKIESAKNDIEYHQKEWEEEVQRVNERNLWVQALKDSLL